jgi:hypothetical protein
MMVAGCLYDGQLIFRPIASCSNRFHQGAAGAQATTVAGVTTEDFNGFSVGNLPASQSTPIGTFSGATTAGAIVAPNAFGGSGGSDYYAVGVQSGSTSATLTFNSAQHYFGMWWAAGDNQNSVTFFSGATPVETFTTAQISAGLTAGYYGNPNNGEDSGEPFVYLDFTGMSGQTFTSVEFDNSLSTGFEMDNLSILTPGSNTVPDATNTGLMLLMMVAALAGCRQTGLCRA